MHELGVTPFGLQMILSGEKTIEICLGKPEFLKLRVGDIISLREDAKQNGQLHSSKDKTRVKITQLLYFETLEEALRSINYSAVIPTTEDPGEVLAVYRQLYTKQDEEEHGIIAVTFKLAA